MASPLSLLEGGPLPPISASSSASSGASGGVVDTGSGAFNFKSSEAAPGRLGLMAIAAGVGLIAGFLLCRATRA